MPNRLYSPVVNYPYGAEPLGPRAQSLYNYLSPRWPIGNHWMAGPFLDDERVWTLVDHFRQDAEFAALDLCDFLGRPDVQAIDAALAAIAPPPYSFWIRNVELVRQALLIVCTERGDLKRQGLVGGGLLFSGLLLLALALGSEAPDTKGTSATAWRRRH